MQRWESMRLSVTSRLEGNTNKYYTSTYPPGKEWELPDMPRGTTYYGGYDPLIAAANELGKDGWEPVGLVKTGDYGSYVLLLKRPIGNE